MTRILFLFVLLIQTSILSAQNTIWLQHALLYSTFQQGKSLLNLTAGGFYNSNFMTNGLADKFLYGGYIDNELKNKSKEKLNGKNYLNIEFESSLNYYCNMDTLFKNTKTGLYFGASLKGVANTKITDDTYNLALYGNQPFGEDKVSLKNNSFYQTIYQSFQFGLFNKRTFSFVSLNIYSGSKFLDIQTKDAFIQTNYNEIDGYMVPLEITSEYDLNYSSTQGKTNLFKSKGIGIGISGAYNFPFKLFKDKESILKFEIEDFGFMKWHQGISSADTLGKFTFTGFESTGLFNFDNSLLDANNIIDSILPNVSNESKTYFLPTKYTISLFSQVSNKIFTEIEMFYRSNCKNNYGINLSGDYKCFENFLCGAELNLFGFTDPNLIVNASYTVKRSILFSVKILNPYGFVNDEATSKGFLIRLTKII